ncbi:DUF4142 domain-containing protein [Psychrobacter sp.]|uniref:DUF4142 domain-containing protein n=1 Tax=Psychrobacter sp. TaxID=56811 RepID=UPI0025F02EAB|nr:DUF4142 domain-containing protein [Psychrobacter sp.]
MKTLTKTLFSCVALSSVLGLTACQSTPMSHVTAHPGMKQDHNKVAALTDAQIMKVLSTANNGEIMQANVAMPKLQSAQAKSFAQGMIEKHTENEAKGQALANKLKIAPQVSTTSNALQMDSNNIVNQLNQTASPADKAYIMSQIMVHDKVLKTIDSQLMPSAVNPELRSFLAETRAAVAMHLEVAKKIGSMMQ